jgi:SAM-dependent methyltransferase
VIGRGELRGIFDEDAELYDRVRPGYPAALFAGLVERGDLGPDRRVLEIGAGTGKATVPLAMTGCRVTAVELGANLAAVCSRNVASFANVDVVTAAFESWPLPRTRFDMVLSATAWHWLDPAVRIRKAAQALRAGGLLAVIETHHVAGEEEDPFFVDVQKCYEQHDPATEPGLRLPTVDDIPRLADTDGSDWFAPASFRRYRWHETYSTGGYLDLLMTYSGHRALPATNRTRLLDCIAQLIDHRYGGQITKHYLTQLWLARRNRT